MKKKTGISLSNLMTGTVTALVLLMGILSLVIFIRIYRKGVEESAMINGEQAVLQVQNTVSGYTQDMEMIMSMIREQMESAERERNDFFQNLLKIRTDVVAITVYDEKGNLLSCHSGNLELKSGIYENLSNIVIPWEDKGMVISKPHVESLFVDEYPWVVTISQNLSNDKKDRIRVAMDIRFSGIAKYVDDVGIGAHGYCFIMDKEGNIIYHPQQQLIFSSLKSEQTEVLKNLGDGSHQSDNVIYAIKSLDNCNWRIVGVSFVDEVITERMTTAIRLLLILLFFVIMVTVLSGFVFSKIFSRPVDSLAKAMKDFEKEAENFQFQAVGGSREVAALSDSFGHMVIRIQKLMEQVRQEEITLRKTELNALQAQINPHFLYNTLDSIAWMCEEERTMEAVEMVNALARLFRISISKGHELISIEKELEHAGSYLKIQKYRYKNRFQYIFDGEEEVLPYLCNKITLQPLIENAIVHGLDMVDEGVIKIGYHMEKDCILLTVEDNGIGMTKEQCEEILRKEAGDRAGIGIKNVNDRIKIYFGNEYGLIIESELDVGTKVEIRIPKIQEETLSNQNYCQ